jgi:signal peptidase I
MNEVIDRSDASLATNHQAPTTNHRPPTTNHQPPAGRQPIRRLYEAIGLFLIALLLFRAIGAEPYGVPTGSMAPTLMGNHKVTACPRCGCEVRVGIREDGTGPSDLHAECPNCGLSELPLDGIPPCRGDHLLVNKSVYTWRKPRRWEMAVFRCPAADGKAFVKRVIGLPGESVLIQDGDIYINGELARKTLAEVKSMCIPVFDNNCQPPQTWACRWGTKPGQERAVVDGTRLRLHDRGSADSWHWLAYRNWNLDGDKIQSIRDEYTYNGGDSNRRAVPVHDFLLEADVEIAQGSGAVAFGVTDGEEWVIAEMAAGENQGGSRLLGGSSVDWLTPHRAAPDFHLKPGKTYHVEVAFVDRRATLAVDSKVVFAPVDFQAIGRRLPVDHPVRLGVRGVQAEFNNVRIFRDVHYTEAGRHAVREPLQLMAGEYFVLGDNSPNSDDSRFWSDAEGGPLPVPEANFLGKPFLVHLPSRITLLEGLGGRWEYHAIDWDRIRWLR